MPKIETPEEFATKIYLDVCERVEKDGFIAKNFIETYTEEVTSRDALLRAKERHEAALIMREELQRTADGTNLEYWVDSLGDSLSDAIIGTDLEVDNDWAEMESPALISRDTQIRQEDAERLCEAHCPNIAGSTDPSYKCPGCELRAAIVGKEGENE